MSPPAPSPLTELAHAHGVSTDFDDWLGQHAAVPEATVRAVLEALGVPAADEAQVTASLRRTEQRPWERVLPPVVVARQGQAARVPMHMPSGTEVDTALLLEGGTRLEVGVEAHETTEATRSVDGVDIIEVVLTLEPDLPLGYHEVLVTSGADEARMPLVITPDRLELPESMQRPGAQRWGVMCQLYAMRSERSWGIGDLADVSDLGAWAAGLGADFVLVNPLHAAEPVAPVEPSPYLPTTRRFVNPLYLRVEDITEVAYLSSAERQLVEWHADDAQRLNDIDWIDRDAAWSSKEAALRLVFRAPRGMRRERAFRTYCERESDGLVDFATWCVLAREHGPVWREWPEQLRDPRSPAVAMVREEQAGEVEFFCWLQWLLAEQLAGAQRHLHETGMALGMLQDLAVGVHPDGADTWALGSALARGVSAGAPADQYNQHGQDWSQPPWRPDRLAELGYAPYRDVVRTALRDAGGLRVDHIMGLFRLWWVPEGMAPDAGTYVRYDHDAMVGILLLEAHRAGALVIGEDLGTVQPWVREYLRERGVLGTSILWFERDHEADAVLQPEAYRELCLATVTTHDLPPTAGYLTGVHVDLRHGLGLLEGTLEEEHEIDRLAREEVLAVLRERGLLRDGATVEQQVEALHRYLAWTPAKLVGVSVSDLAHDTRVINQPGTDEEYPNWRVPLAGPEGRPVTLEELFTWRSARRLARTVSRTS